MALVLKDRVKETTTTTGTGTYTLAGAVTGFEAFSSVGDGNTTYYACTDGTDFEVGIGTYTASGTTLARTTILQSSNSDSAVSWSSGTKTIFCAQPAEKAVFLNASDNIELADDEKIVLGTGGDLEIFHDGSNSIIKDAGTGNIELTGRTQVKNVNGELMADFVQNGATKFYHDNSLKLETASGGISVTGEVAATSLDISGDVDVDGTLEADAMTLDGTAITTTATLSTGISNNNVPKFTSGVADNDFLRVDGTAIEGRSASEVLSDIAAMPLAGGTFTGNVTLSNVGDVTLTLEADTDNATESDNPSLVLSQDGGGTVSKLRLNGVNDTIFEAHTNGNLHFQDSSARDYFKGIPAGAVELYHNNSKKLETASGGISVTGEIAATSLDISGDVDVDGTLEADAITVNGTALNTVIADEATALAIALG